MKTLMQWLERSFWCVGLLSLGYCGAGFLDAWVQQASHGRELDQRIEQQQPHAASEPREESPAPASESDDLIGRIEIPRLEISAMVLEGADDRTLRIAVGHLPGTARPGGPGNVVLAAHRDTFFQSLEDIHKGDWIMLTTPRGRHHYRVEDTVIVNPDNTEVLRVSTEPIVTLITCYPFHFVGPAPQRFVVRARESEL